MIWNLFYGGVTFGKFGACRASQNLFWSSSPPSSSKARTNIPEWFSLKVFMRSLIFIYRERGGPTEPREAKDKQCLLVPEPISACNLLHFSKMSRQSRRSARSIQKVHTVELKDSMEGKRAPSSGIVWWVGLPGGRPTRVVVNAVLPFS